MLLLNVMRLFVLWSQIVMVFLAVRFAKQLFCLLPPLRYRSSPQRKYHGHCAVASMRPFLCVLRVFECVSVIAVVILLLQFLSRCDAFELFFHSELMSTCHHIVV